MACLLGLIKIGSVAAFNDNSSLTVGVLYFSYLICAIFLLWRRCTGGIAASCDVPKTPETGEVPKLVWGLGKSLVGLELS